ncbi:MAG: class I SAM-dependent methyltransferase [Anaerolineales bacterium]|nr:class I SAM-dependent methyltransferase [Anaerolineales bacterium]
MTNDNTTPHKSGSYDRDVRQTIPFYETMQFETVDLVRRVSPDAPCWLDTGCGTGFLVEIALPLFPNTEFILADPSAAMLDQAKRRLEKWKSRVRVLEPVESQDLETILDEAKPAIVTVIQSHHYLIPQERRQATQACFNILPAGGLFVTLENIMPASPDGVKIGLERWKHFQLAQGRSPSTVESHLQRFNTKYFPITVDEHLALYKEAGFRVVELFWYAHVQAGFYAIK